MSTTDVPGRFTTLPDETALQATIVALEEHGFSVAATTSGTPRALAKARDSRRRTGLSAAGATSPIACDAIVAMCLDVVSCSAR
jgi:hypothetical protein